MTQEKDKKFEVLSDDELDQAAGGSRDGRGRTVVTPVYGCGDYSRAVKPGIGGTCSTCEHMYWDCLIMYCRGRLSL